MRGRPGRSSTVRHAGQNPKSIPTRLRGPFEKGRPPSSTCSQPVRGQLACRTAGTASAAAPSRRSKRLLQQLVSSGDGTPLGAKARACGAVCNPIFVFYSGFVSRASGAINRTSGQVLGKFWAVFVGITTRNGPKTGPKMPGRSPLPFGPGFGTVSNINTYENGPKPA